MPRRENAKVVHLKEKRQKRQQIASNPDIAHEVLTVMP
jgi:hypothetical protein